MSRSCPSCWRFKRIQHEGHDLDIDAVLDAGIALRTGCEPDLRIFRSSRSVYRDLAALLLIDISESMRDRLASGVTILDVERLAVAVLAEAMDRLGDPFSLLAFASDGREDVKMTTVKYFDESYDRACMARLAGLRAGLSTRLGAALRHAGHVIGQTNSGRKLVIVLTDGEPSDIDVTDPLDLVEDARRAAIGLHGAGIDAYGVVLGKPGIQAASRIFGRGNTMMVHRIEDLPGRLRNSISGWRGASGGAVVAWWRSSARIGSPPPHRHSRGKQLLELAVKEVDVVRVGPGTAGEMPPDRRESAEISHSACWPLRSRCPPAGSRDRSGPA